MAVIRITQDSCAIPGQKASYRPTYFISDLHLDLSRPETIELCLRFFAHAKHSQAVFIMGDLFEYWLGDDAADPSLSNVYDAIAALTNAGTDVHLMHGNRDFLLGEQFAKRAGATLHREDHLEVDFGSARYSLVHGDTLCTDDVDYQKLRHMVRDPNWQQAFLALSIDERIAQAQALRDKSREAVSEKQAGIMDVNKESVESHFATYPNDGLIHGHTHRPFDHVIEVETKQQPANTPSDDIHVDPIATGGRSSHRRLVLGDWKKDHAMIARFDGTQLTLEKFLTGGLGC